LKAIEVLCVTADGEKIVSGSDDKTIIASESDERFTYLSRVIELGAPDEMLEELFKVLAG
jgi:hypothetical protein